jgi:dienelactone hydrolase
MVELTRMVEPREQAVLIGARKSLVGILTTGSPPAQGRPAVVILNSGIVHRVGANRMSVSLARALAAAGFPALRFDLSGIGDSEPRDDGLPPLDGSLADVREALDWLESSRGYRRVVLAGLCSGADHALLCARTDARVVGAALLDPSIPRTRRHYAHHYAKRLLRLESWLNLARGESPVLRSLRARLAAAALPGAPRPAPAAGPYEPNLQSPEVRAYLAEAWRMALAHGVRFLAVETGERSHYRAHLRDAFPDVRFGDQLRLEWFGSSDHMFSAQADRARVIRVIVEWAQRTAFAASAGEPGARGEPPVRTGRIPG